MQMTAIGRAVLASREGVRLKAYKDSVGIWTIGVGHTAAAGAPVPRAGMTITAAECDTIFARDLAAFERGMAKALKVRVADHEFDALVSFAFNVGVRGAAASTVVKKLNAGDKIGAAKAFLMWKKPPEILDRRQAEMDQFMVPYSVSLPKARRSDARPVKAPGSKPIPVAAVGFVSTEAPAGENADQHSEQVAAGEIPDAAPSGSPVIPLPSEPVAPGLPEFMVRTLQIRLRTLGYFEVGIPDGKPGPRTIAAVSKFQAVAGLPVTGQLDKTTIDRIGAEDAPKAPVSPARANTTAADLREAGSTIATNAYSGKLGAIWKGVAGAGTLALTAVSESFDAAWEKVTSINAALGGHGVALGVGVLAVMLVAFAIFDYRRNHAIEDARVADERSGKTA